jgi:hypothetical protein
MVAHKSLAAIGSGPWGEGRGALGRGAARGLCWRARGADGSWIGQSLRSSPVPPTIDHGLCCAPGIIQEGRGSFMRVDGQRF